jgi:hypothetical protein
MRHEQVCSLKPDDFRRLTGIKRTTFDAMMQILREAEEEKMQHGGRPHKLDLEDRLLIDLFRNLIDQAHNCRFLQLN